jgi:hypothetical protein
MFFVIDFETSSLLPWEGQPLTVGIVPVNQYGEILEESNHLYVEFPVTEPDWHLPANLTETERWWLNLKNSDVEGDNIAFESAWYRESDFNKSFEACVLEITDYFMEIEPDYNQRFICANPVAFDKMWLDNIYSMRIEVPPYHYRSLCLRSMRYGLEYGQNPVFGSSREDHEPLIPHHALHDARAEAYDLKFLMSWSKNTHFLLMQEDEEDVVR